MKLRTMETAGKIAALMAPATGRQKAAALARTAAVAGWVLGCCLACHNGQPPRPLPASTPAPASSAPASSAPASNGPASSQAPAAPASAGQAARTAPKSQYLSNLDSVASSGSFLAGDIDLNGHHYPHSVTQILGPGSVSYDLGRRWRTLDVTLELGGSPAGDEMVQFQVKTDSRIIFTGDITLGQSRHVRLNVVGVARLGLATTLVSGTKGSASPVWSSAELLN
jgi:NPCBM/NEW2 domain